MVITACAPSESKAGGAGAPELVILSPDDNEAFPSGMSVLLVASAIDDQDGDLSSNIEWTSSLDGDLGLGASRQVTLSLGEHQISATINDADGNSSKQSISISILEATGVATLQWVPPIENENNTPLTNLKGYRIYYGLSSNRMDNVININDASATSFLVDNLITGRRYYFSMTAINEQDIESKLSRIVQKEM